MKILVTGGSGMLGKALIWELSRKHQVSYTIHQTPFEFNNSKGINCDLTGADLTLPHFDAVVHAAALTDVDYCQSNPEEAYKINVTATRNLVKACPGAYFVYISTDFVFDGQKGFYRETDPANPLSEYGRTKYLGEKEIPPSGCVLRTSIYGLMGNGGKPTFIEKALEKLKSGQELYGFDDQWFSPISTYNLVQLVDEIIEKRPAGVLHLGGAERISKYQFMQQLARSFGYPESLVRANSFLSHKFAAPRPRDVSIDITKAKTILESNFYSLTESFQDIKTKYKN